MIRNTYAGELRKSNAGQSVALAGWVARRRDHGGVAFIDLRDTSGSVQVVINDEKIAGSLRAEWCVLIHGKVRVRPAGNENKDIPTGEIEIECEKLEVLSEAAPLPFPVDSGDISNISEEVRLKYRYLDLRREEPARNLRLRYKITSTIRSVMDEEGFNEVETPYLTRSTPEGARDFLVPVRLQPGSWYALPQSPQLFKQLLMVAGFDRYYQIVKCFRDEDLRADRQPEFTQIDCEMSFIEREDILQTFEGLVQHLFRKVKGIEIGHLPRMSYADAMKYYGCDKPDTRFEMKFVELNEIVKGKEFKVFDDAELVVGINAKGCAEYTRKQLDELTDFVKKPQIGATGLVYARINSDGTLKSSVDKFYDAEALMKWSDAMNGEPGDLLLILAGPANKTRKAMNELRLEMGTRLGLRDKNTFSCLWVVDFPLLEYNEEVNRYFAMHHPFTSPLPEDLSLLESNPGEARANAYDMVINGVEVGGGSIRIYNKDLQAKMFSLLGFSPEEAQEQFGFLMNAFEFGAPPHGGIAFGFDRLCSLFGGSESIRDFIAFPKNNSGRDVMIDAPSAIHNEQLTELGIKI